MSDDGTIDTSNTATVTPPTQATDLGTDDAANKAGGSLTAPNTGVNGLLGGNLGSDWLNLGSLGGTQNVASLGGTQNVGTLGNGWQNLFSSQPSSGVNTGSGFPSATQPAATPTAANKLAKPAATQQPINFSRGAGMHGAPVKGVSDFQGVLKDRGFDLGKHGVDGRFGPDTEKAVKAAQQKMGLPANGRVDNAFMDKLSAMPSKTNEGQKSKAVPPPAQPHRPVQAPPKVEPPSTVTPPSKVTPASTVTPPSKVTPPSAPTSGTESTTEPPAPSAPGRYSGTARDTGYAKTRSQGGSLAYHSGNEITSYDESKAGRGPFTIAADPRVPGGTKVHIDGLGDGVVDDTGGAFCGKLDPKTGLPTRFDIPGTPGREDRFNGTVHYTLDTKENPLDWLKKPLPPKVCGRRR